MNITLTNLPKETVKVYIMTQTEFKSRKRCTIIDCKVPLAPGTKKAHKCEHHTAHSLDELI